MNPLPLPGYPMRDRYPPPGYPSEELCNSAIHGLVLRRSVILCFPPPVADAPDLVHI